MKWKIKAKSGVQLLSIGQTLPRGAEVEWEADMLPKELDTAKRQGLIEIEVVGKIEKEPVKPTPKPEPKKVEPPEVKEEVEEKKADEKENAEGDEEDDDEEVDFPEPSKPLKTMSKDELIDYAKEIDLDYKGLNKADLLKAIEKWIE